MDSQGVEGKKLNIQIKNRTSTKIHSTPAARHTPPRQPFICTSPTTSKSETGRKVHGKLFIYLIMFIIL